MTVAMSDEINERIEQEAPGVQAQLDRAYKGYALLVHRENPDGTCATDCMISHDTDGHMHREAIILLCEWMYKDQDGPDPPELSEELLKLVAASATADTKAGDYHYKNRLALAMAAQACLADMRKPQRIAEVEKAAREILQIAPPAAAVVALPILENGVRFFKEMFLEGASCDPPKEDQPPAPSPPAPSWVSDLLKQEAMSEAALRHMEEEIAKRAEEPPRALGGAAPIYSNNAIAEREREHVLATDPDAYGGDLDLGNGQKLPIFRYAPGEPTVKATCRICGVERKFSANDPRVPDAIWGCSMIDCPTTIMPNAPEVDLDALVGHVAHLLGQAGDPRHEVENKRPLYTFAGFTCSTVEHIVFDRDLPHETGFLRFVEKSEGKNEYLVRCSCGQTHVAEVFACQNRTVAKEPT